MNLLETVNLSRKFGGLIALNDVNFAVEEGASHGLIGPNGAGKTTLFNIITGHLKPTQGRVFFRGEDITGLSPHMISQRGIARTFQLTNIFPGTTVYENIWIGVNSKTAQPWNPYRHARNLYSTKVNEISALVGLSGKEDQLAGNLSYGDQKLLEIAIALSTDPLVALLDEPTQGVSPDERDNIIEVIGGISAIKTIILIEHDMETVLRLSRMVTVLDKGKVIAQGPPQEISTNEAVQRIYLGTE